MTSNDKKKAEVILENELNEIGFSINDQLKPDNISFAENKKVKKAIYEAMEEYHIAKQGERKSECCDYPIVNGRCERCLTKQGEETEGKEVEGILPCPFCGGNADITSTTFGDSMKEEYRVTCIKGDCLDSWCNTKEEAIKEWNKRHASLPAKSDQREVTDEDMQTQIISGLITAFKHGHISIHSTYERATDYILEELRLNH